MSRAAVGASDGRPASNPVALRRGLITTEDSFAALSKPTCRGAGFYAENNGEPWRARTSDPLIKSALTSTPAGYGFYDLLPFVTGCSRQRVHQLLPINASLPVFWSQVGHTILPRQPISV